MIRGLWLTGLLLVHGVALGEIYRWVDQEGNVHFGDRPRGQGAEQLELKVSPSTAPSSGAMERRERESLRRRMLEVYAHEREEKREAEARRKAERQKRAKRCKLARNRLDSFSSVGGIYDYDDQGERVYLNESQRRDFMEGLRRDVRRFCR